MKQSLTNVYDDVEEVLLTEEQILNRCKELGHELNEYYSGKNPIIINLLKGSTPFCYELCKTMSIPITFDCMKVSSYAGTNSTGKLKITLMPAVSMENRHLLIVEDIIDSGITLSETLELLKTYKPASVEIVTLLDKPNRRTDFRAKPKWIGFTIPDKFVIGFGLDYNEKYRQLPFIGVLKPEVYQN